MDHTEYADAILKWARLKTPDSDRRKRRSGQTYGLYFVVMSGGERFTGQARDILFESSSKRSRPIGLEERAPGRPAGAADGRTTAVVGVTTAAAAHARHTPRARVGERPPATNTAGARSAAAPMGRPAPPTLQHARVAVPAVATVATVRHHVICTDRGARRLAPPAAATLVVRDMAWSEAPPPPPRADAATLLTAAPPAAAPTHSSPPPQSDGGRAAPPLGARKGAGSATAASPTMAAAAIAPTIATAGGCDGDGGGGGL